MRVDLFLKTARLVKRRSVAKELCEDGAVTVNGQSARPGREVKVGDRLVLSLWNRTLEVEIVEVPARAVSVKYSRELYHVIGEARRESVT